MEEKEITNKTDLPEPSVSIGSNKPLHSALPAQVWWGIVAVSLLFGVFGGAAGSWYLLQNPKLGILRQNLAGQGQENVKIVEESSLIDVVKKASPAVVSIVISKDVNLLPAYGSDPFNNGFFLPEQPATPPQPGSGKPNLQEVGAGSGFLVSADGLILTNKHVVADEQASYTVVMSDGAKYEAKVLARDPREDLALVKIEVQNAPFLKLGSNSQLQIGQRVVAIGNSLGQYQNTVTSGIVSGVGRSITAGSGNSSEQLDGVIQTDAAINPGNSGGPLLDLAGDVVGVNTAIDQQGQLVGFAISASDAARALGSFEKYKKIVRPFLGVRYVMVDKDMAQSEKLPREYGALVVRGDKTTDFAVVPGSPADKAGIAENDIILEVDGQKVDGSNTLSGLLKNKEVGDVVTLKIYHKGAEKLVNVTLEEAK